MSERHLTQNVKTEVVSYPESPLADSRGLLIRMTFGDKAHIDLGVTSAAMVAEDLIEATTFLATGDSNAD